MNDQKKRKRRIMRSFRIDEISAVDRPAQQGARMTIMKRAEKEKPMPTNTIVYTQSQPIDIGPEVMRKVEPEPREPTGLQEAADMIRKRDGGSRCAALSQAAGQYPALLAKHNEEGLELPDRARREPFRKAEAVTKWHQLVAAIRSRDGCSHTRAMSKCVEEYPAEFQAYQQA